MALRKLDADVESPFLARDESLQLFDRAAQSETGMSGPDFLRAFDRGDFANLPDTPEARKIMRVIHLVPFGRQDPK